MCGRFTLARDEQELAKAFHIEEGIKAVNQSYNIAPSQNVPIVYVSPLTKKMTLERFKWGLIPSWAKTPSTNYSTINARAETLTTKPAFRKSLSSRRCLVPADSFFEWDKKTSPKQPFRILRKDQALFAFAGLWDEWVSSDKTEHIKTFTIITTVANELIQDLHDRMPVIIDPQNYEVWLKSNLDNLKESLKLLRPYPSEDLTFYPVSSFLNSPRNNTPECIKPLAK